MIRSEKECAEMIDDIMERGYGLSEWEQQFIDNIYGSDSLTTNQREVLDRIHEQKVVR